MYNTAEMKKLISRTSEVGQTFAAHFIMMHIWHIFRVANMPKRSNRGGYDWVKGNLLHSGCFLPKGSLPEIHHGIPWFLLAMSTDSYISSPANFCRPKHHIVKPLKIWVYFPYPLLIKLEPAIYIPRWASVDREAKSKPTPFFTSYLDGVPLALNAGHR